MNRVLKKARKVTPRKAWKAGYAIIDLNDYAEAYVKLEEDNVTVSADAAKNEIIKVGLPFKFVSKKKKHDVADLLLDMIRTENNRYVVVYRKARLHAKQWGKRWSVIPITPLSFGLSVSKKHLRDNLCVAIDTIRKLVTLGRTAGYTEQLLKKLVQPYSLTKANVEWIDGKSKKANAVVSSEADDGWMTAGEQVAKAV